MTTDPNQHLTALENWLNSPISWPNITPTELAKLRDSLAELKVRHADPDIPLETHWLDLLGLLGAFPGAPAGLDEILGDLLQPQPRILPVGRDASPSLLDAERLARWIGLVENQLVTRRPEEPLQGWLQSPDDPSATPPSPAASAVPADPATAADTNEKGEK